MFKLDLVSDWRNAWKWYSVNAAFVAIVINALQEVLPLVSDLVALDPTWVRRATAALAVVAIVGRVLNQTPSQPSA